MSHYSNGDVSTSSNVNLAEHFQQFERQQSRFIETFDSKVKSLNDTVQQSVKRFRRLEQQHNQEFIRLDQLASLKPEISKAFTPSHADSTQYFSISVEPLTSSELNVFKQQHQCDDVSTHSTQAADQPSHRVPPGTPNRTGNDPSSRHAPQPPSTPKKHPQSQQQPRTGPPTTPHGEKRFTGISRPLQTQKPNNLLLNTSSLQHQHAHLDSHNNSTASASRLGTPQRMGTRQPLMQQQQQQQQQQRTQGGGAGTPLRPIKQTKINASYAQQQQQQLLHQKGALLTPTNPQKGSRIIDTHQHTNHKHTTDQQQLRPRAGMSPASRPRDPRQHQQDPGHQPGFLQESIDSIHNDTLFSTSSPIPKTIDASFQSLPRSTQATSDNLDQDDNDLFEKTPLKKNKVDDVDNDGNDNDSDNDDDNDVDLFDKTPKHKQASYSIIHHEDDDQVISVMVSSQHSSSQHPKYSFSNATAIPRTYSNLNDQQTSSSHRSSPSMSNASVNTDESSSSGVYIRLEPTNPAYIAKMQEQQEQQQQQQQPKKFSFNNNKTSTTPVKKGKGSNTTPIGNSFRAQQESYARSIPSMLQSTVPPATNICDNFAVEVNEVDSDAEAEDLFHEHELPDWARDMKQVLETHRVQTIVDADLIFKTPKGLTCDLTHIFNDPHRHKRYVKRGSSVFPPKDQIQDEEIERTNAALNILAMAD